jgi:very-short-patch-repair endonuclease
VNQESEARSAKTSRWEGPFCRLHLKETARRLDWRAQRKASYQSLSERFLARHLQRKGVSFKSQFQIHGYSVDFLVPPNLIVEAEGKVHSDRQEYDSARTSLLESFGFRVFRIPNYMIFSDPSGIAEMIRLQAAAQEHAPQDNLRPSRSSKGND